MLFDFFSADTPSSGVAPSLILISSDANLSAQLRSIVLGIECQFICRGDAKDIHTLLQGNDGAVLIIDKASVPDDVLTGVFSFCEGHARTSLLLVMPQHELARFELPLAVGDLAIDYLVTPPNPIVARARIRHHLRCISLEESLRLSTLHMTVADRLLDSMISSRKAYDSKLRMFKTALDAALDAVVMLEPNSYRFIYFNQGVIQNFGYDRKALHNMSIFDLVTGHDRGELTRLLGTVSKQPAMHLNSYCEHNSGRRIPIYLFLQFIGDLSDAGLYLAFIYDRSDHVAQTNALEYQGAHDSLTGLPNRTLLFDRCQQAMSASRNAAEKVGLILIDVDRFKEVNDSLGHPTGDRLLQQLAAVLPLALRESDTVARLGGDEFAVVVPKVDSVESVLKVAKKITSVSGQEFEVDGHKIHIRLSMGVVLYPDHGNDIATLVRRADVAMYVSKRNRAGCTVFDPSFDRDRETLFRMESELRDAIQTNQLDLYYQPKVDVRSGELVGVEALVRWPHPQKGMIMPDAFIAISERSGLIHSLTEWVIDRALRDYAGWHQPQSLGVMSINLSAQNLHNRELPRVVSSALNRWGVDPARVEFEITESDIMRDPDTALSVMSEMNKLGVHFAIDDYGTGYSSLAYLKKLPFDTLKIDRSFVSNMIDNSDDLVIVRSTIDLAHNLGLSVVAEGVESQLTWDLLRALGCDTVQGYIVEKPVPKTVLARWITSYLH